MRPVNENLEMVLHEVTKPLRWPLRSFAAMLLIIALTLLVGGVELVLLGGSRWYAVTGLLTSVCAVLLWRGERLGSWIYGFVLCYSIIWSIAEVGLAPWGLMPRLLAPMLLGLILLAPWLQRGIVNGPSPFASQKVASRFALGVIVAFVLGIAGTAYLSAPRPSTATLKNVTAKGASDWPNYGNDAGGSHFAELDQLTPANVGLLKPAWEYRTGDLSSGVPYAFEATPLKIGKALYLCTPGGHAVSLDAETGKQIWRTEALAINRAATMVHCRGVSYVRTSTAGFCSERIIWSTSDSMLRALDASTGRPCLDFGDQGMVDLRQGLGKPSVYFSTSPPAIIRGLVVLGAAIPDNESIDMPSGVVRAYNPVSGTLAWAWDMGHPDRAGMPPPGQTFTRSTPNAWAPLSADEKLGLVYVPMGNPAPDHWGDRRRPFDEKYGSALVALDVATGQPRWSFQMAHHDLWDLDVPSQPTLADIPTAAGMKLAVIQATKQGDIFVLDRRSGEPIAPVSERPVPRSRKLDTYLSPTQPMSAISVAPQPVTEEMMWGATPLDQLYCRIQYRKSRYEGPYTPPSLDQSLHNPGLSGVTNWGGVSVDPKRLVMIVNGSNVPYLLKLEKRGDAQQQGGTSKHEVGLQAMLGTPYMVKLTPFLNPLGIPCNQPPWGKMHAFDLRSGRELWARPVGTSRDSGPFGIPIGVPLPMGVPQFGGTAITRSGLIFAGATADNYLRAYATSDGRELWRARLPAGGQATPMTYISEVSGRQFVVISSGGSALMGTKTGDFVLASVLPKRKGS
jgi:quinoprotein glucose dehydrogenase